MTTLQLDQSRLAEVMAMDLTVGSHDSLATGLCVMEAASFVAGEPWSDAPDCTCPVIGAFLRNWNDSLRTNEDRDRLLKPLIPVVIGTRSTKAVEMRRATMAADWLIRVHTPAWLRLAKLEVQAAALEQLPEITDFAQCPSLMTTLNAVRADADAARAAARDAARDAAWAAAGAAARDAARDAAGAAAGAAARDAAWAAARDAARDAARAAAWAAARAAAWAAAWAAARAALNATTIKLQDSAAALVRRMAAVTESAP